MENGCSNSRGMIYITSKTKNFLPTDDWLRLVDKVHYYNMKPKPKLDIQFLCRRGRYSRQRP